MIRIYFVLLLSFCCALINAQAIGDFQSAGSGNWNLVGTWQTWNGVAWVVPGAAPTSANGVITILAGHTILQNVPGLTVDQVIVNGTLQSSTTAALGSFTVANGPGIDLLINGTFWDQFTTGVITWTGTWSFGPVGTLLKTSASASNTWQASYNGGIATIPATSNWILRKIAATNPVLTTIGAYYGNLIIENNVAGIWNTSVGSTFQGAGGNPIIKGNFDVGGTGTSTVNFLNQHTSVLPSQILGNVTIRLGSILANNGTGLEIQGNLIVTGSLNYGIANSRRLDFKGGNAQSVSGAGSLNVYNCTLAKSGNSVTLLRAMTVDNLMTFTTGIINTTTVNLLTINTNGTVAGANNTSFVNGPIRYTGNAAFTFPVGKNADYQALSYNATIGGGGTFWTETFGIGCNQGQLPGAYTGPNGTWSTTQTGFNGTSSNDWFISATEAGMGVGACGNGCLSNAALTNRTLHVGSKSVAFFCPTGDCGAAYNAGPASGTALTDIRAESPVINCTGQSSITLSFLYMETGASPNDNGTVWYFDGSVWAFLADPIATNNTGCAGQGRWTAYSVLLPATANNNPNVKIGFRWVNNDDGVGTDPSDGIDDVTLSTATTVTDFTCEYFYANPQVVYNNVLAPTLNSISACEYWTLVRNAGTQNKIITVTWDGNSCPAIPTITDTRVAHFDLTLWQNEGNGGNTGTTGAGTVTSAAAVTYFGPFTIGLIPITPTPIEMLRFDGNCVGNSIALNWSTATETNNDYFDVERSIDGITYSNLGTLNGSGNSTHVIHYEFDDTDPFAGTNYYRIKQTDFNGQFSFSKIIAVDGTDCGSTNLQLVSTSFNSDELQINYLHGEGPVLLEIYDPQGKLICKSQNLPPDFDFRINTADWSKSVYFIRVSDGISTVSRTILR